LLCPFSTKKCKLNFTFYERCQKYVKNLGATHNFGAQEIQYKVYFSDNNVLESWDTELEFNYTYSPLTINSNESYLLSDYQLRLPNTSVGVKYLIMKLETMYPSLNDPYHPEYWTDRDMTNNIFVLPITVSNNWIGKPNVAFTNNTGTYVNVSADLVVRNNPRPTFRVELSNKNGEFTNPLKIDDAWIDGNNYGVTKQNDIYLPANLEYGSNYKIRLVCVEDGSISPSSDPFSINGTPVVTIKDLNEAYTAGQPNFLLDINTSGLVNGIASQGTFYVNNTLLNTTNTVNGVYTLDFSKNATYTVRFDYVQNGKTYSVSKTVNVTGSYDIIVSGVPTSPICAGGSFNLSYTAQGTYKSDNNFTVELSDANGNFTNPLVINVIQSAVSGTITCAVPVTLAQCLKLQSICQWRCGYFDIDI